MSTVTRYRMAPDAGRAITRRDSDAPDWGHVVELLLGPVVTESDRARRRADALALSAAAMKAAEEITLANQK